MEWVSGVPRYWDVLDEHPVSNNAVLTAIETMDDDPSSFRGIKPLSHTKATREYSGNVNRWVYANEIWEEPSWVTYGNDSIGGSAIADPDASFGSSLSGDCMQKIHDSSPEHIAENSMMFLKDLRATIKMVRNPVAFLKVLAKKPSKLGPKATLQQHLVRNGMTATSNGWLEYQFGWRPLIDDIKKTVDTMAAVRDQYNQYVQGNKSPTKGLTIKTETASSEWESLAADGPNIRSRTKTQHRARCLMHYVMQPSSRTMSYCEYITQRMGLNAGSIIPALWDAIPYSFIVDWFIPVGDFLQDIAETPVKFDVVSTMYDNTSTGTCTKSYECNWLARDGYNVGGQLYTDTIKRYSRGIDPFVSPADKSWYNNTRALDILALIVQKCRLPIH
jgi:hypothetical protein